MILKIVDYFYLPASFLPLLLSSILLKQQKLTGDSSFGFLPPDDECASPPATQQLRRSTFRRTPGRPSFSDRHCRKSGGTTPASLNRERNSGSPARVLESLHL
jgi:hypothetical protein